MLSRPAGMGYASCRTLLVALCLSVLDFSGALVVPGGGRATHAQSTGRVYHEHRERTAHRRLRGLSLAPRAQAGAAETVRGAVNSEGGELSSREVVEQAGKRLIPLFAQVDAHTRWWVFRAKQ